MIADAIKEKCLIFVFDRYKSLNKTKKVIVLLVLFVFVFFVARLGLFGGEVKRLSVLVFPLYIKHVDPHPIRLNVLASFEYQRKGRYQPIEIGGEYKTKDIMSIKYSTNIDCWILILGVSNAGAQSMLGAGLEAVRYKPHADHAYDAIDFMLDDEKGVESYYVFASKRKFTYEKDIEPFIYQMKNRAQPKGATLINQVSVPDYIVYRSVYFSHI
ncbi:MAG: hypothetical protein EP322_00535 [Bacteroidetes bacterium]|nr:MAG: hypothetical protein EP322_00535 [Bacteroidota bacterium]